MNSKNQYSKEFISIMRKKKRKKVITMKIGVYVGSFNPPHKGHIKIVNHLINNYLDKVIIIPTGNYWDKFDLIDIQDRINMLKIFERDFVYAQTNQYFHFRCC